MGGEPQIVGLGGHGDTLDQTRTLMRHVLSLTVRVWSRVSPCPPRPTICGSPPMRRVYG